MCFWQVGTSEIWNFSNQKSSKIVPAIQTCFLMPQINQIVKKWLQIVPSWDPKIHQKPEQQGNGKRGMRNEAQKQWIPGYSWACPTLPNHSKCFPLDLMFISIMIIFYFKVQVATVFKNSKTAREADRFVSIYKYTQNMIASCSWIAITSMTYL